MRVAEAAGTDSVRTRDGPDSAVDRAAMEVNVTAAVHRGPGSLPAMATTLLARTENSKPNRKKKFALKNSIIVDIVLRKVWNRAEKTTLHKIDTRDNGNCRVVERFSPV